jgi:hypothetical protein
MPSQLEKAGIIQVGDQVRFPGFWLRKNDGANAKMVLRISLFRISGPQVYHLIRSLQKQGKIHKKGEKRHAFYTREA